MANTDQKDLTPEELVIVAITVTGWHWDEYLDYPRHHHSYGTDIWNPLLEKGFYLSRSQALAVVEWINNKIETVDDHGWELLMNLHQALRGKDITALMRMVLELGGNAG